MAWGVPVRFCAQWKFQEKMASSAYVASAGSYFFNSFFSIAVGQPAAVRHQGVAGEAGGGVGRQVERGLGHFLGAAQAVHGGLAAPFGAADDALAHHFVHGGGVGLPTSSRVVADGGACTPGSGMK